MSVAMRCGTLPILLVIAVLATLAVGPSAYADDLGDDYFGAHGNAVPSVLSRLAANGVGVERRDANWFSAEPTAPTAGQHSYVWIALDDRVRTLALSGLRYYPVLEHAPRWARLDADDEGSPPANFADYSAFVAAFASRYGEGGTFWLANPSVPYLPIRDYEIWNEPNSPDFWNPTPRPSEYFALYRQAQIAIHAVQPSAAVVLAGPVDSQWRDGIGWLQQLEKEVPGALAQADAIGFHPYRHNKTGIVTRVVALRQMLADNDAAAVPIEITEFGAPAAEVSLSQWSSDLTAVVKDLASSNCGISRIIAFRDQDPNTGNGVVDTYGYFTMYDPQGDKTRLADAFFKGIAEARRARPSSIRLCAEATATPSAGPQILSHRIRLDGQSVGKSRLVSYRLSKPGRVAFTLRKRLSGQRAVTLRRFTLPGGTRGRRFRLAGAVGKRTLARGRYRLIAVALDSAGHRSDRAARSFRIFG